jgi:hypothetical protein
MFIQVIQGRCNDAAGLRKQADKWMQELRPGAAGVLGATEGVTDDGEFIAFARFESEEDARRNSDRPEQSEWWAETEKYLENVTFHDCTEVEEYMGGGSDDAGFVQVIQGRSKDKARMQELAPKFEEILAPLRPDIIGGFRVEHPDGTFSDVNYFTSEKEARENESKELPDDAKALFEEWMSLIDDVRYLDLRDPWLFS